MSWPGVVTAYPTLARGVAALFMLAALAGCERVTVTGALVAGLEISPPETSVVQGESVQLSIVIRDEDGHQLGGREIAWSVDDPTIAAVSDNGLVRGLSPGVTAVRAHVEGATGSALVTVLRGPTVGLAASSVTFTAASNGPAPASVPVAVFNDGAGSLTGLSTTVDYGVTAQGWLTATLGAPTAPTVLTLAVDATDVAPGTHAAIVRVASAGESVASLAVTFSVEESSAIIGVSRSMVSFALIPGSEVPAETVQITNLGGQPLVGLGAGVVYPPGGSSGWLAASLSPTTAPSELRLSVDGSGLGVGTYVAEVRVSAPDALNSPVTIDVLLDVQEPTPRLRLTPETASFTVRQGDPPPPPVVVAVDNAGGGSLTGISVGVDYGSQASGWLRADLASSVAPTTITLAVIAGALEPGTYEAGVIVTSPGADNSPARLSVTLTVLESPPLIVLSPGDVDFTVEAGQGDPDPVEVQVSNGGGGALIGLSASVSYASGQPTGWLGATLAATVAPTTMSLAPTVAGLDAGLYEASVTVSSSVAGVPSVTVPVSLVIGARPAAPSELSAMATSPTTVELAWTDNTADEDSFLLERRTDGGAWTAIGATGANAVAYTDTGLTPETSYDYRVRACVAQVCSSPSNEVSVTTPALPTPPDAPSGLTATAASESAIDIAWSDNSDDESSFEIERSGDGGVTWSALAQTGPGVEAYTDAGLPASTSFGYRVRACNAVGCSDWSTPAFATTLDPPAPPEAPSDLAATAATHDRVDLTWSHDGDSEDSFEVERSPDGGATWAQIATLGANSTAYADLQVAPETAYAYRVRACAGDLCSSYSNVATVTTPPAPQPPAAPSGFTATPASSNTIDLAWTDNSDDEDRFELEWGRRPPPDRWEDGAVLDADQVSFSATNLQKNKTYEFRLRACNETACSSWQFAEATTPN